MKMEGNEQKKGMKERLLKKIGDRKMSEKAKMKK